MSNNPIIIFTLLVKPILKNSIITDMSLALRGSKKSALRGLHSNSTWRPRAASSDARNLRHNTG